jgi:hypothetical protein
MIGGKLMRLAVPAMLLGLALWPLQAGAVTQSDFQLETAQDLLNLCMPAPAEPLQRDAIHMCYGFMTGAMHYHRALASGPDGRAIVCPDGQVTRADVVQTFIEWAQDNPQHMQEPPVEALARAAVAEWPCQEQPPGVPQPTPQR